MSDVTQPSLFSAETLPPELDDLSGLLAAHGQVTGAAGGTRLSILVGDVWRADAIAAECRLRGLAVEVAPATEMGQGPSGVLLVRTEATARLADVATRWTRGAVKAVPDGFAASVGALRVWIIAAGRPSPTGYLLGLDPHAPGTHQPLAAVCARAGFAGAIVGGATAAPVIRLTGRKRILRLAEFVGDGPPGVARGTWPGMS